MHKQVPLTRGKILVIYLSMFFMLVMSIAFSAYQFNAYEAAQRENARNAIAPVCAYIKAQIDVYEETPPTTPTGMKVRESITALYQTYQCDKFVK